MNIEIINDAEFGVKFSHISTYFTIVELSSLALEHITAEKSDELYVLTKFLSVFLKRYLETAKNMNMKCAQTI